MCAQLGRDLLGSLDVAIGNGNDDSLRRRKPQRQVAARVLDEYAVEALDGAKECAMEHPRTLARVIGRAIRDVEALGQIEVDLAPSSTATSGRARP